MEENKDELVKYKPAKTVNEMVDHLFNEKRVRYNTISREEAKSILLKYNYINVISPFKHYFAKKSKDGKLEKINNKHIYERDVEFSEYYELYRKERKKYPTLYTNISEFENHFKSIIAYHILIDSKNKISNSDELKDFLVRIKTSLSINSIYSVDRKQRMIESIDALIKDINKYHDVYCFFDRMSLGSLLCIYIGLDSIMRSNIYKDMCNNKQNLFSTDETHFIKRTFMLVGIRNYIMHNNSLEILIRFYDPKNKTDLRKPRQMMQYRSLIEILAKEKQPD